jgi:DNA invertase Pin-like site-specific DNA recombinase
MGCCNPRHLEWKTKRQNENDKILHGTLLRGSKIGNSRLTETDVLAIRAMVRVTSQSEVAKAFGIAQATVSAIQRRIIWGWLP